MALDADPEHVAQIECLFVGEPEFASELVDPDFCCQVAYRPFFPYSVATTVVGVASYPRTFSHRRTKRFDGILIDRAS